MTIALFVAAVVGITMSYYFGYVSGAEGLSEKSLLRLGSFVPMLIALGAATWLTFQINVWNISYGPFSIFGWLLTLGVIFFIANTPLSSYESGETKRKQRLEELSQQERRG